MSQDTPNPPDIPMVGHHRTQAWFDWWSNWFKGWGDKTEQEQEARRVIADLQQSIASEQIQLSKYQAYLADGLPFAQVAITATNDTIKSLEDALNEKLKEYASEGLNVTA